MHGRPVFCALRLFFYHFTHRECRAGGLGVQGSTRVLLADADGAEGAVGVGCEHARRVAAALPGGSGVAHCAGVEPH